GTILACEHAVGRIARRAITKDESRLGLIPGVAHNAIRSAAATRVFALRMREGWEADERPEPRSLGLLPSGPDPVGEWLVPRQPPASISAQRNGNASGRQPQSTAGFLPWAPSSCACLLEKRPGGAQGFAALLVHAGEEIEAVPHAFANEVLDLSDPCRAQFLREGAVVVDKRVGRASGDERGRIFAQVGPRGARVRVRPVLAVDEIGAADEPDEGGIIDD